jgi:hemolysin III
MDRGFRPFMQRTVAAQIHLLGALFFAWGSWVVTQEASALGDGAIWATRVFAVTGLCVLVTSSVYHFLANGFHLTNRAEMFFENLDHFSIFLFIAGTYTPFFYFVVKSEWRDVLLWTVWVIAAVGIVYTQLKPSLPHLLQKRGVGVSFFVLMGWTFIIRAGEILSALSNPQFMFLLAGGLSYTVGAVIYARKKPDPWPGHFGYHEIWHVLVLGGFGFHWALVTDLVRNSN